MSDETFLGFPVVCNDFDDCRDHQPCRDYRAWQRNNYHSRAGVASSIAKRQGASR